MRRTSLKFVVLTMALLMVQTMVIGAALSAKVVTGKVVSATDGEELIGATVQVQGTQTGTVTDFEGNFKINANEGQTLVVSYVGFLSKQVKVGAASQMTVQLEEDKKSLDEVVVIGYGVQKKKLVTGATLQVKGRSSTPPTRCRPCRARRRV